jgi:segregation and condensation protein A
MQPRRITIEGQLSHVRETLQRRAQVEFRELLSGEADRTEVAVTLLAILELIKRREVRAFQEAMFGPIQLKREG